MIPILFDASAEYLTGIGTGRLSDAISCTVTQEYHGRYEMHLEYPVTGRHMDEIRCGTIIGVVCAKQMQGFRVYRITRQLSGIIEVDAEHLIYQLQHIPLMDLNASSMDEAALCTRQALEPCPFRIHLEDPFEGTRHLPLIYSTPKTMWEVLFGDKSWSFRHTYGVEWKIRGFDLYAYESIGKDTDIIIRYGKNLLSLKQEEDTESAITGLCAYWRGKHTDGKVYVVTTDPAVIHTKSATTLVQKTIVEDLSALFEKMPTQAALTKAAETRLNEISSRPKLSLSVSYADFDGEMPYVDLYDTVTVVHEKLGVLTRARIIRTVWDVLLQRYQRIDIGDAVDTLSTSVIRTAEDSAREMASMIGENLDGYATRAEMNSSLGELSSRLDSLTGKKHGVIQIPTDVAGQTERLTVLCDSLDSAQARKLFSLDRMGLLYSDGGKNGPYRTIIGEDGKLRGEQLAGTVSDGRNCWNLDTGEVHLAQNAVIDGKSISRHIDDALATYDSQLDQRAVLAKLNDGQDDGCLYLDEHLQLRLKPEKAVPDAIEQTRILLPTRIEDGRITDSVPAIVRGGVIYPDSGEDNDP